MIKACFVTLCNCYSEKTNLFSVHLFRMMNTECDRIVNLAELDTLQCVAEYRQQGPVYVQNSYYSK